MMGKNSRGHLVALCLLLVLGLWGWQAAHARTQLRLGVFVGSSWDVPSSEGYAVVDNGAAEHRYYLRTAAPLDIPAEAVGEGAYLTGPVSVRRMHDLAKRLRETDPGLFFAGIQ